MAIARRRADRGGMRDHGLTYVVVVEEAIMGADAKVTPMLNTKGANSLHHPAKQQPSRQHSAPPEIYHTHQQLNFEEATLQAPSIRILALCNMKLPRWLQVQTSTWAHTHTHTHTHTQRERERETDYVCS
jgi:hypothetical protein